MAYKPLNMNKLKQLVRLYCRGTSIKQICKRTGIARNTVRKYIERFRESKLTWPDFNCLEDHEIYSLFQHNALGKPTSKRLQELYDFFPYVETELRKVGVTKKLLWEEYLEQHPNGYQVSQFKHYYTMWSKQTNPTLKIPHKAGDKMFVDYAGKLLEIVDPESGEITAVQVYIATLGASQYTYIEASMSQKKDDFITSTENALHFFGGVPAAIVPDNLKSAVTKVSRYEPTINETFADFTLHYQTCPLPARVRKPKDKALVEGMVNIAYKAIYAKLRKQTFFSLKELNQAILSALELLNCRTLTGKDYSRKDLFEQIESKTLGPLPAQKYEIKSFAKATVMQDCHVCLTEDKHYYSVPNQYIRRKVKIIYSKSEVEIYYKHQRIAFHKRLHQKYGRTTLKQHLLAKHQYVLDWNPTYFIDKGNEIGAEVGVFIERVMHEKTHLEQAYKICSGILSLEAKVGSIRLNNACKRAIDYRAYNYQMILNILEKGLDIYTDEETMIIHLPTHTNIRGNKYYTK